MMITSGGVVSMVNWLTAGTLAQKWLGLYAAQKIFFASFIIWVGPIPLPGGYTLTGGSPGDQGDAREWISLFMHEAVIENRSRN